MLTVLLVFLMAAGILSGAFLFSRPERKRVLIAAGRVQQVSTAVLLFAMGLWLGGNGTFWAEIKTIGLYGLLFALVTVVCSVGAVALVARLAFKGRES